MTTPPTRELDVPRTLASKYRVGARLGEGGMGIVYEGDHLELETRVAIKVLQPARALDPEARARFMREARLAASIEGEHSTRIYDVGDDGEGRPFLVMELLSGESLDARLARVSQLELEEAATILVQLADVLAEAHAKRLVHRDLKPENLFLADKPGEPIWLKVLDFGISKTMSAPDEPAGGAGYGLTAPRTLLGSPEYMSPEQVRDAAQVDARSDLWACGVLLFELLTGRMPFEGASLPDLYAHIVGRPAKTFAEVGKAGVPPPVARLVERCLRKAPEERPRDALEIALVLAPFAQASARMLLPRIRAWCRGEEPPEGARSGQARGRRLAAGVALMASAGAGAFFAAAARSPTEVPYASPAPSVAARPPASPLTPPPASPRSTPPAPESTGADPTDPAPAEAPKARAKASKKNDPGRIHDLDGIELIP